MRRVDEAYALAQAAKAEAATAVGEIRAHAAFCTEREATHEGRHLQNLRALGELRIGLEKLRNWVVGLIFTIGGTIILGLLTMLAWGIVHFVLAPTAAHAAPPDHADPALAPWFQSLSNPKTGISCCREYDGHILRESDWRVVGDGYQVRIEGAWVDVPAAAVLDRVPNPTGGAVVFYSPYSSPPPIYCFVRPTET